MLDRMIIEIDKIVKTLFLEPQTKREIPGSRLLEADLSDLEKKHVVGLIKVNHCGEVCAQALYMGQALTSRSPQSKSEFEQASKEEEEHLAWTLERIRQLDGRPSILNPLFYFGALTIGIGAGILGDKWNLGFLEETEIQVGKHLKEHLTKLPIQDLKSIAIIEQMVIDENQHAQMAKANGAVELPYFAKLGMRALSKIMTNTVYYL